MVRQGRLLTHPMRRQAAAIFAVNGETRLCPAESAFFRRLAARPARVWLVVFKPQRPAGGVRRPGDLLGDSVARLKVAGPDHPAPPAGR